MKHASTRFMTAAVVGALLGLGLFVPAWADGHHHFHHHHSTVFVGIGDPFWPWYGPPYYPTVVAVPTEPPTYIEQGDASEASPESSSWYYCPSARAYYPYVTSCPEGWRQVAPSPSP